MERELLKETGDYYYFYTGDFHEDKQNKINYVGLQSLVLMKLDKFKFLYIFDEVGTGKTVQALYVIWDLLCNRKKQDAKILIITGNSRDLALQWQSSIERFLGKKSTILYNDKENMKKNYKKNDIYITYSSLRGKSSGIDNFLEKDRQNWDLIIFDEAQDIFKPYYKKLKYDKKIKGDKILFLTATPDTYDKDIRTKYFDFLSDKSKKQFLKNYKNTKKFKNIFNDKTNIEFTKWKYINNKFYEDIKYVILNDYKSSEYYKTLEDFYCDSLLKEKNIIDEVYYSYFNKINNFNGEEYISCYENIYSFIKYIIDVYKLLNKDKEFNEYEINKIFIFNDDFEDKIFDFIDYEFLVKLFNKEKIKEGSEFKEGFDLFNKNSWWSTWLNKKIFCDKFKRSRIWRDKENGIIKKLGKNFYENNNKKEELKECIKKEEFINFIKNEIIKFVNGEIKTDFYKIVKLDSLKEYVNEENLYKLIGNVVEGLIEKISNDNNDSDILDKIFMILNPKIFISPIKDNDFLNYDLIMEMPCQQYMKESSKQYNEIKKDVSLLNYKLTDDAKKIWDKMINVCSPINIYGNIFLIIEKLREKNIIKDTEFYNGINTVYNYYKDFFDKYDPKGNNYIDIEENSLEKVSKILNFDSKMEALVKYLFIPSELKDVSISGKNYANMIIFVQRVDTGQYITVFLNTILKLKETKYDNKILNKINPTLKKILETDKETKYDIFYQEEKDINYNYDEDKKSKKYIKSMNNKNEDINRKILIGTWKSVGTGLNIYGADTVIAYELPANLEHLQQGFGRIDRAFNSYENLYYLYILPENDNMGIYDNYRFFNLCYYSYNKMKEKKENSSYIDTYKRINESINRNITQPIRNFILCKSEFINMFIDMKETVKVDIGKIYEFGKTLITSLKLKINNLSNKKEKLDLLIEEEILELFEKQEEQEELKESLYRRYIYKKIDTNYKKEGYYEEVEHKYRDKYNRQIESKTDIYYIKNFHEEICMFLEDKIDDCLKDIISKWNSKKEEEYKEIEKEINSLEKNKDNINSFLLYFDENGNLNFRKPEDLRNLYSEILKHDICKEYVEKFSKYIELNEK